jgi:hypothetical protein
MVDAVAQPTLAGTVLLGAGTELMPGRVLTAGRAAGSEAGTEAK